MRYPEYVCPVHLHERLLCDMECAAAREAMRRLGRDYRQFWHDRGRGIRPAKYVYVFHDRRPVGRVWGIE